MNQKGLRGRRQYSAEFKARVVALCQRDAVLVAEVALMHDVDAALLRRWIRRHVNAAPLCPPTLVPVQLEPPAFVPSDDSLRLDIRKGSLQVQVHCPASAMIDLCFDWLRSSFKSCSVNFWLGSNISSAQIMALS